MSNIRISIYEDYAMLRESIGSLLRLSENLEIVGEYDNVLSVADQIKSDGPIVVLMDIDMPGMSGIEAVKTIRAFDKSVVILMLTIFDDTHHVLDAICAGASGYLLKKHISSRLVPAIEDALAGGAPMSASIARMVITSMQSEVGKQNSYDLTPRERDILSSLSKGNSFKLIANDLLISIDTVRTHIKKIYEKLHVHSQTEAVAKAINEKLV
jgi:DNA-binding NarL/FixJ family response regulator